MKLVIAAILCSSFAVTYAMTAPPKTPPIVENAIPSPPVAQDVPARSPTPPPNVEHNKNNKKPVEPVLAKFMRKKLDNAELILEGLVMDDFRKISDGADALLKMSSTEQWRAHNDVMYLQHSREFQTAVKSLQKKVKEGSLDGAGLAYMNVTMSCIRCHEWVRDVIVADAGSNQ